MRKSVSQERIEANASDREAEKVAWALLEALDQAGTNGLDRTDPFSGKAVRVKVTCHRRDSEARLAIEVPRSPTLTIRRLWRRKGRLGWGDNKAILASVLGQNRNAMSFLRSVFPAS